MRWQGQTLLGEDAEQPAAGAALPGLGRFADLVRTVQTPEFAGITFHEVLARSALNKVPRVSMAPFDWTVNPYRGCSHACVYCFARGTHRYLDLDTGDDFDRQIVVKVNVVEVLTRELRRASWTREPVALGTNTDPYQRAEGRYRLMPGIIEALAASGTPLSLLTKGTLARRDLPLLAAAGAQVPVNLGVSIALADEELHALLEGRAEDRLVLVDLDLDTDRFEPDPMLLTHTRCSFSECARTGPADLPHRGRKDRGRAGMSRPSPSPHREASGVQAFRCSSTPAGRPPGPWRL